MSIYVGQTFRATASVLKDAAGVTLVAPAVTINLTKPDGTTVTGSVTQVGSTYWAEFIATLHGLHKIVAQAVAGGGTWIGETPIEISQV